MPTAAMIHKPIDYYTRHIKNDISAGIVVFLVALPLCLGIAQASGAPLFSGLIAGMVGGLIVSWLSGSQLSVSGPTAGLTVIVFNAIETLGSFSGFLVAVVLAGILQIGMGFLGTGIIGAFFPSAVIQGMLAAIGLILIMKQIPHAIGYDISLEGHESYMAETAFSTTKELWEGSGMISPGAAVVGLVALFILIVWDSAFIKRTPVLRQLPGALIAVIWGVLYNAVALRAAPAWAISGEHLLLLPVIKEHTDFFLPFTFPDFSLLAQPRVYVIALTLAIIASLETLLNLEAVDRMDPLKRTAPASHELKAQGVGNIISGLLGGLPITAVIVHSAANAYAGAHTKIASFVHGLLLLLSVMFFTRYLNTIPLSCLAAILLQTGYKLAKPALFVEYFQKELNQRIPFAATVIAILLTDLLKGILIGMAIGLYYVIRANFHTAISMTRLENHYLLKLNQDVGFLDRALLRRFFNQVDGNSTVIIDGTRACFIDHDILETIEDFVLSAADNSITVETICLKGKEKIQHSTN